MEIEKTTVVSFASSYVSPTIKNTDILTHWELPHNTEFQKTFSHYPRLERIKRTIKNNLKNHPKDIKVSCLWEVRVENAFKQLQFEFSVQIHNGYFYETVVIHSFLCFFLYNSDAAAK